jgi:hypothetical protein
MNATHALAIIDASGEEAEMIGPAIILLCRRQVVTHFEFGISEFGKRIAPEVDYLTQ